MICSHCGRKITKPAAVQRFTGGGIVVVNNYGPICAVKLKLIKPAVKAKKAKMTRTRNKANSQAFWAAQQDLFEALSCTA